MAQEVGNIRFKVGLTNKNQFTSEVKQLGNSTSSTLVSAFGKVGTAIAAAFSVGVIVKFGKACVDLASDLAEVQNVVDVTYSTMSDKVNEFAKNAAQSYGLSETMAKKYMGTLGSMAEAFGFSESEAEKMSETLTGLAGDVASFYNITQDEAYTKLKSVFTGETESLKELGVVMTQNALDEYALANGYGKTTSAMSEQEKVSLRLAFVTNALSNANGDFSRTSNSWANQTRILSLQLDQLKANLGDLLINVLTPLIQGLNKLIGYLVTATSKLKELLGITSSDGSSSAAVLEDISTGYDDIAESAEAASKSVFGFDNLNRLTSSTSTTSGGTSGTSLTTLQQESAAAGDVANKVSGIDKAISGINEAISALKSNPTFQAFSLGVQTVAGNFKKLLGYAKQFVKDALKPITDNLGLIKGILNDLGNRAMGHLTKMGGWFITWGDDIDEFLDEHFMPFCDKFTDGLSDINASFLEGYDDAKPYLDEIDKDIDDLWDDGIGPFFSKMLDKLGELYDEVWTPLWEEIEPDLEWLAQYIMPVITAALSLSIKSAKTMIKSALNFILLCVDILLLKLELFVDLIKGDWSGMWETLKKKMADIINDMAGILQPFVDLIADLVETVTGLDIGFDLPTINISKTSNTNTSKTSGTPTGLVKKVNAHAIGGVIQPRNPHLAILGDNQNEREVVSPESTMVSAFLKAMKQGQNYMNGTQTIENYVVLDGRIAATSTNTINSRDSKVRG